LDILSVVESRAILCGARRARKANARGGGATSEQKTRPRDKKQLTANGASLTFYNRKGGDSAMAAKKAAKSSKKTTKKTTKKAKK